MHAPKMLWNQAGPGTCSVGVTPPEKPSSAASGMAVAARQKVATPL